MGIMADTAPLLSIAINWSLSCNDNRLIEFIERYSCTTCDLIIVYISLTSYSRRMWFVIDIFFGGGRGGRGGSAFIFVANLFSSNVWVLLFYLLHGYIPGDIH